MRLGQFLIADGVIGGHQLQEALDLQLTHGGHLGTCLIELGHLSEELLGQALAQASGVPCATSVSFLDIPRFVLDAVPRSVVQRHSAVPIALEDKILDVAMIDPKNAHALDELRRVSGCVIRSWIAPEVRIFEALERYYDVPRRVRYVTLCRTLDKGRPALGRTAASRSYAGPTSALLEPPVAAADPLTTISELFCDAASADEVADLVLDAVKADVRRRILFRVQGGSAYVWRSAGAAIDRQAIADVRFPILAEPVFGLLDGDDSYAGPLPFDPIHLGFFRKLGISTPKQIVLLPVHSDDQLIAIFYGDCGLTGTINADVDWYRRLLAKAALAINVVLAKHRIHAI
jgi:hypothetical protein